MTDRVQLLYETLGEQTAELPLLAMLKTLQDRALLDMVCDAVREMLHPEQLNQTQARFYLKCLFLAGMSLSSTGHSPRLSKARLCGTPELREMERIVVDSLNGEPTGLPELLPGSGVYLLVEQFFSMKLLRVERGRFRASHVEYWKIDCDSPATLLHGLRQISTPVHFFDGDDFQRIVLAILDDHRHMARVFVRAFDYTYDPSVQSIFLHPPIYHRLPKTALQRWLSVFDLRRSTWRWFLANYEFGATAFAHTTDFIDYCALLGCSV